MTLQEAKDQVAREKNFKDWVDMLARDHYTNIELRHDKAAELYARSKWNEACEAQKRKCANAYFSSAMISDNYKAKTNSDIKNAYTPEFTNSMMAK